MEIFNERIKELRKQFGYTQKEIASMLGISQPSYIRYEIGSAEPNLKNLCKLADIFDVSADYLLGRSDI